MHRPSPAALAREPTRWVLPLLLLANVAAAQSSATFQPSFHQALRWSVTSSGRTVYRLKIPSERGGARARLSIRAGSGALRVYAVTVAPAGTNGALAGPAVAVTFGGSAAPLLSAGQRLTSDLFGLAIAPGAELSVSLEVDGALAASAIDAFPDSWLSTASHAGDAKLSAPSPWVRAVGLDTLEVEAAPSRAFLAIGDSITEGFVTSSTVNDYRQSWGALTAVALGVPVVNAAVYGQGVWDAAAHFDTEVLPVTGITDCLVLLGTNDLGAVSLATETARLAALFDRLRPICRPWAATLPPKENPGSFTAAVVNTARQQLDGWLQTQADVAGVIDFATALQRPDDPNRFQDGLGQDGVHPTVLGQQRMAAEATRVLGASLLRVSQCSPSAGTVSGGTSIAVSGAGFGGAITATFGGSSAVPVTAVDGTHAAVVSPAHAAGAVELVLRNGLGDAIACPGGFTYQAEPVSLPAPVLSTLTPARAPTAGQLRITASGSAFVPGAAVLVDGAAATAVVVEDATTLSFLAPVHPAGAVDVKVRNPDGQTSTLGAALLYTSEVPAAGDAGTGATRGAPDAGSVAKGGGADGGSVEPAEPTGSTSSAATTPTVSLAPVETRGCEATGLGLLGAPALIAWLGVQRRRRRRASR